MRDLEDEVIARIVARTGARGVGDDAAVLGDLVVSTDTMVEGTHWDARVPPEDVGWRLVACNVSDLAAMGATPAWAVLALTLPTADLVWVDAFATGFAEAASNWGLPLVGGDTTRGPVRVATLTVGGHTTHPVLRSTARPGDGIWVTGELGHAAAAFEEGRRHRPEPPLAFAIAVAPHASAMMDLSDGLLRDLQRLTAASHVGAEVQCERVPGVERLDWRVGFGEDFQLLLTAPPSAAHAIQSLATMMRVRLECVGRIVAEPGVRRTDGAPWPALAFAHFPAEAG